MDNNVNDPKIIIKAFDILRNYAEEKACALDTKLNVDLDIYCTPCNIKEINDSIKTRIDNSCTYNCFTLVKPIISDDCTKLNISAYSPKSSSWTPIRSFDLSELSTIDVYLDNYTKEFLSNNKDILERIINLILIDSSNPDEYTSKFLNKSRSIISDTIKALNTIHPKEISAIDKIMKNIVKEIDSYINDKYKFNLKYSIDYDTEKMFYSVNDTFNVSLKLKWE